MTDDAVAQPATPSRKLYPRAAFLRATGTFGKDVLRTGRVAFAIGMMVFVAWCIGELGRQVAEKNYVDPVTLFQVFLPLCAYLVGLLLAGEDEENDTRFFADRLPMRVSTLLCSKIAAGAVVWLVAVTALGCVMAFVSSAGSLGDFLHFAFGQYSPVQRTPLVKWLLGSKGALWCATLFLTGLAIGSVTRRHLLIAGVVGYGLTFLWIFALFALAKYFGVVAPRVPTGQLDFFLFLNRFTDLVGMGLWNLLAIAITIRRFATRREGDDSLGDRLRSLVALRERDPDELPAVSFMAHRDARVWGVRYLMGMALLGAYCSIAMSSQQGWMLLFASCFALSVVYGVVSHPACETDAPSFFLHALPIPPAPHLRERLLRIASNAVLGLPATAAAALLVSGFLSESVDFSDALADSGYFRGMSEDRIWSTMLLAFVAGCISTAWIGYFTRGFFKSTLVAIVTGFILATPWVMIWLIVTVLAAWLLPWVAAVSLVLSGGAIWIAERHSLLNEMNDGPRMGAWLLAALNLGVWGPFLMTMWPPDIFRILF